MILDSLRYWVKKCTLTASVSIAAAILARDGSGSVMPNPPVLWDIESDSELAGTKLIAEAWDAAGLYQVGSFVGDSWREWNGRFRDDVRSFFRGEENSVRRFADRIVGSPEIYGHKEREMEQSINFVTCHDGFTLNDLVSYNHKHNEANGEENRDGEECDFELLVGDCEAIRDAMDCCVELRISRSILATLSALFRLFASLMPSLTGSRVLTFPANSPNASNGGRSSCDSRRPARRRSGGDVAPSGQAPTPNRFLPKPNIP